MKKLLSVLLVACMMTAIFVPCITLPASANNVAAAHPSSVCYDYSDWDDHCIIQGDKYTNIAAGVIGINGDPALTLTPMKQSAGQFPWNHFAIPFAFEDGKTYVISYDITLLSQLGKDTPDAKVKWVAFGATSDAIYGDVNSYKAPIKDENGGDSLTWEVSSGEWTHVTGYLKKDANDWNTTDCLFFYEEPLGENSSASQIAIDNLIIMEKTQFEIAYPNGSAPKRTDVPAVDMIAANFNTTRYMPFLATDYTKTNATAFLDVDGRLKWSYKTGDNVFSAFNFQSGKTYHLSFDIALDPSHATDYPNGVTLKAVAMDSSKGVAAEGVEAFTGCVAIQAGKWTHIEMTLTPANAHKFFGMVMETAAVAETTVMWIDNYKLYVDGKEPSCPITERTGNANPGVYMFASNFEDGRNHLHRGGWWWNTESSIYVTEDGNSVEKVRMDKWSRNFGYMSFTKNSTYVLSFDVYGVSKGDGTPLDGNKKLRAYAQQYGLASDKRFSFTYKNGDDVVEDFAIVPGQWTHYTAEVTVTASNYNLFSFALIEDSEVIFYIDNLTIVEKKNCTEAGHTAGVWKADSFKTCTTDGHSQLLCAVCGAMMDEKTEPKGHVAGSEQIVVTTPTCTEDGTYKIECVNCHETLTTGAIAKLGHTAGEWEVTKTADCHETGSESCKCTVCGAVLETRDIPKTLHIEGKWVVDVEAAPGVEGHRYKKCTLCGDVIKEETLAALPVETTEEVTDASEVTSGDAGTEEKGCQSAIGGFSVLAVLMAAGVAIKRKKH